MKNVNKEHEQKVYPHIMEALRDTRGKRILEVCCGDGALLNNIMEGYDVIYGIESDEELLIQAAHKANDKVILLQGDERFLPFFDHSLDVVYCVDMFSDSFFQTDVLKEVQRVLKQDGIFLVADYLETTSERIKKFFQSEHQSAFKKAYGKQEIEALLQKYFDEVTCKKIDKDAMLISARRK